MLPVGPKTREQLDRMGRVWSQGEHVLISGSTGSGKTLLARHVDELRAKKGGFVIVFVCKIRDDATIVDEYAGWTRWYKWKDSPKPYENRVLLWPDTSKCKTLDDALKIQKEVFAEAFDGLMRTGKWTVHIDEGLYVCSPTFMNMADELAMLHFMGRSSKLTMVTLTQRPSHLPLILYSSASHVFAGRMREQVDTKRLSELGGKQSARELAGMIDSQDRHDFLWIPVAPDWLPEDLNIIK